MRFSETAARMIHVSFTVAKSFMCLFTNCCFCFHECDILKVSLTDYKFQLYGFTSVSYLFHVRRSDLINIIIIFLIANEAQYEPELHGVHSTRYFLKSLCAQSGIDSFSLWLCCGC